MLLIALGLMVSGSVMAQKPNNGKPVVVGPGDTKTDNYTEKFGVRGTSAITGYYFEQINKSAGQEANTAFITVGGKIPFYVAPNFMFKNQPPTAAKPTTEGAMMKLNWKDEADETKGMISNFTWELKKTVYGANSTEETPVYDAYTDGKFVVTPDADKGTHKANTMKAELEVKADATAGDKVAVLVKQEVNGGAFKGCSGKPTIFTMVAVEKPNLWISSVHEIDVDGNGTANADQECALTTADVAYAESRVAKGDAILLFRTCKADGFKKVGAPAGAGALDNSAKLTFVYKAREKGVAEGLARYAFALKGHFYDVDAAAGTVGPGTEFDTKQDFKANFDAGKMLHFTYSAPGAAAPKDEIMSMTTAADGTVTPLWALDKDPEDDHTYDHVFVLSNASDVKGKDAKPENAKLVSAISMRSYPDFEMMEKARGTKALASMYKSPEGFKFNRSFEHEVNGAKKDVAPGVVAVVIRVQKAPKTGPVYHIPVGLFK